MQSFEKVDVKSLENSVKAIGDDWMLITVADEKNNKVNAMTASWGALGVLWNRPVCICFIRPERYTYKLLESKKEFSIAFLGKNMRSALTICGRQSGADCDKLSVCGLTTTDLDGVPVIAEADATLVCKVLYEGAIEENGFVDKSLLSNYESAGYHGMFVCEVINAYRKEKELK